MENELIINRQSKMRKVFNSTVFKVFATAIAMFIIAVVIEPSYLSVDFISQLIVLSSFLGIVAMGQTAVILIGGLDLSVAYALNLGGVMVSQMSMQMDSFVTITIILIVGVIIGALNGMGVVFLKVSPLIMTLGMNSILKTICYVYTNGTPQGVVPDFLVFLGTGQILGIRAIIWAWALLSVIVIILLRKTSFGRKIYVTGNNIKAAYISGINTKLIIISVFAMSGLFAVIAGMLLSGFTGLPYLGMGDTYQMNSIAATVIGGTIITGGRGGYAGTIGGVLIIFLIQSILTILNIADAGRHIINGIIILVVLMVYGRGRHIRA